MPIPLLILSDDPSCSSGLGRITRDLALRIHEHLSDVFEVATVGYGGPGSRKLPFRSYHLHSIDNWLVPELPSIWEDFVGDQEGILFSIWDASRLYWLGMPQTCSIPFLRKWVETAKMKKWLYGAIDAAGPKDRLSFRIAETMKGFDRVLDYSAFSCKVTGSTEYIPHGIDTKVFYPRDHAEARTAFAKSGFMGLKQDSLLVGIVATNQARKNWQLGMETCRILLDRGHDVHLWAHTDVLDRHWSIGSLIVDYGLQGRAAITTQRFTDDQLAWMYSACDVTLGIAPEGFGYPIAESLACGVPCIVGSYGAQAEYVPEFMQIDPTGYFYEGAYCSKRPLHDPKQWAVKVEKVRAWATQYTPLKDNPILPPQVDWNGRTLWPLWEKWFREGA